MNDSFAWWLVIAGIAIGVGLAWLVMGRLPRAEDDVSVAERGAEAAWISNSIAEYGGNVPEPLVEEILELHRTYLEGPPAGGDSIGSTQADAASVVGPPISAETGVAAATEDEPEPSDDPASEDDDIASQGVVLRNPR